MYLVTTQFIVESKTYHVGDLVTKDELGSWFYMVNKNLKEPEWLKEVDDFDPLEGFLQGFLAKDN
jgi:hypothetical protein